jgi:hypothetical protein
MKAENYNLKNQNGHLRVAAKVILDNGREIRFMDKLSKKEAVRNALELINRFPNEYK